MAALAALYHGISGEWGCLTGMDWCEDPPGPIVQMYENARYVGEDGTFRPWTSVTALLTIRNLFVAMAAAVGGCSGRPREGGVRRVARRLCAAPDPDILSDQP